MRVLVSGAGIAGSTLAWFLAKTGARITVIEKAHALLPHGQSIEIQGSAITAIQKMGLMNEIRRFNTTEMGTQFIDTKGRPFARFPIKEGRTASFSSEFEILRGDLAAVLYEATKSLQNVTYRFSTTVKRVVANDDESVKVELNDGQIQDFDLLVAADGQWSKVRKQCFPPESITVVDTNMYATYWTVPRIDSDNEWWNVYHGLGSRIITLRPDPYGSVRPMFTLMPCNDAQKERWQKASRSDRKTQQELLKMEFADAGWQAQRFLDGMDQAPDFYFQAIQQIRMSKWSNSRVVCLGDAACAPTPLTGMGTTIAITGAYILAAELNKLKDGEHPSRALEAYENTFRPYVEEVQKIPSFIPAIAHPETALKRWLLQMGVLVISKVVALPWIVKRLNRTDETNDNGFPLPRYPGFLDEYPK